MREVAEERPGQDEGRREDLLPRAVPQIEQPWGRDDRGSDHEIRGTKPGPACHAVIAARR